MLCRHRGVPGGKIVYDLARCPGHHFLRQGRLQRLDKFTIERIRGPEGNFTVSFRLRAVSAKT